MKTFFAALGLAAVACAESQLLLSEYVEGRGYNKAVEVANVGTAAHDFAAQPYSVRVYRSGLSVDRVIQLDEGALQPGHVLVVANSRANFISALPASTVVTGALDFNGDDTVVLVSTSGKIVDAIGEIARTMTPWLKDTVLRRAEGSPAHPAGFASLPADWVKLSRDDASGLGCTGVASCTAVPTTLPPPPVELALTFGARVPCAWAQQMEALVAAYEQQGAVGPSYDADASVWTLRTGNPTIRTTWTEFLPAGELSGCLGDYRGTTDFYASAEQAYKRLAVTLSAGADGALRVTVDVSTPPVLTSVAVAPQWAGDGFVVNCPSTSGSGACSSWTLFEKLHNEYRSHQVGRQGETRLLSGEPSFADMEEVLRTRTIWGRVWSDADVAVLREYCTAFAGQVELKAMEYEERAWDTYGKVFFVYNKLTRTVLAVDKLIHST